MRRGGRGLSRPRREASGRISSGDPAAWRTRLDRPVCPASRQITPATGPAGLSTAHGGRGSLRSAASQNSAFVGESERSRQRLGGSTAPSVEAWPCHWGSALPVFPLASESGAGDRLAAHARPDGATVVRRSRQGRVIVEQSEDVGKGTLWGTKSDQMRSRISAGSPHPTVSYTANWRICGVAADSVTLSRTAATSIASNRSIRLCPTDWPAQSFCHRLPAARPSIS